MWIKEEVPAGLTPVVQVRVSGKDYVIYALQPKQMECYSLTPLARPHEQDGPTNIGYGGAAGGGKSHLARAVACSVAMLWPGSTSIIFRKTKDEVRENHIFKLKSEFPDVIDGQKMYNYTDMLIQWLNGSRTHFGFLREEKDVFRYQGPEYDVMIFEEATHYSSKQVTYLTGNRLRATVDVARPFVLYPSNPGSKGHAWFKRLFISRKFREDLDEDPDDFVFLQGKLSDNKILTRRDPGYARRLNRLPEPWKSWQRDGDWSAGAGSALAELDHGIHMIQPFEIPDHWTQFGALDWGYAHPFSFGHYAVNEDGMIFKIDTITGHRLKPFDQCQRIRSRVDTDKLQQIVAGHDCWSEIKAYGDHTPSIADQFQAQGIYLSHANIDRKAGLNNMRRYLSPAVNDGDPYFRLFNTKGNEDCFTQLENMVADESDLEDVQKIDADELGEGGDDMYDETRYGLASRPMVASSSSLSRENIDAWSKDVLLNEYEKTHRHTRAARRAPLPAENLGVESIFGEYS